MVDGLKGTREILYKLGTKAMNGSLERWLAKASQRKPDQQDLPTNGEVGFRIASSQSLD